MLQLTRLESRIGAWKKNSLDILYIIGTNRFKCNGGMARKIWE